jgi:hypothetical protein
MQRLLTEAGVAGIGQDLVSVDPGGVEAAADWDSLWSPENSLGYQRTENFASPNGAVLGTRHVYAAPARLALNLWALSGDWTVQRQAIVLHQAEGGSPTASTPATCTWSWHRHRQGRRYGPTCASTGSPREPPTEPT